MEGNNKLKCGNSVPGKEGSGVLVMITARHSSPATDDLMLLSDKGSKTSVQQGKYQGNLFRYPFITVAKRFLRHPRIFWR